MRSREVLQCAIDKQNRPSKRINVLIDAKRRDGKVFDQSPEKSKLVRSRKVLQFAFDDQHWLDKANEGINRLPKAEERSYSINHQRNEIGEIAKGITIGNRESTLA